jgi:hypothetical protein
VIDAVAIGVEVEAFLSDRRCGECERPKGRVKGIPNASQTGRAALFVLVVGESHGEAATHLKLVDNDRVAVDREILDVYLRGSDR